MALAVGKDTRIGSKFLSSGPGFGGSCFKKDILNLVYISRSFGLDEIAEYWEGVLLINNWQQDRIYKTIVNKLYGNLNKKKILILGFAFKANTNDTRNSPSIGICRNLLKEGANLIVNDPKVSPEVLFNSLFQEGFIEDQENVKNNLSFETEIYKAVVDADAILILTDWDDYKLLDWNILASKMRQPAWIFDTRDVISKEFIKNSNINIWKLGNGNE